MERQLLSGLGGPSVQGPRASGCIEEANDPLSATRAGLDGCRRSAAGAINTGCARRPSTKEPRALAIVPSLLLRPRRAKKLDKAPYLALCYTTMKSNTGPFTFAELQEVTSLGRGEIRECINRGIISAPAGVGQGNHRAYSTWNLVEGVVAAALLKHVRAGSVAHGMTRLRSMLEHLHIDPEEYCKAPGLFAFSDFRLVFPPRSEPDDKAGPPLGEEMGEGGYLLATARASNEPYYGPPLTPGTPLAAVCRLSIDLAQAVRFVEHMIETKL